MAEETSFGVARLRQAIANQATCGIGQFELSIDSADKLCREIEAELARLSWAAGVPVPRDADGAVVPLAAEEPSTNNELYTNKGEKVLVDSICFNGFFWYVKDVRRGLRRLDRLHRTKRDSWELLEKDVSKAENKGICGYFGFAMNKPCSTECPARDVHDSCAVTAMCDVLRRAKALAERDAKITSKG